MKFRKNFCPKSQATAAAIAAPTSVFSKIIMANRVDSELPSTSTPRIGCVAMPCAAKTEMHNVRDEAKKSAPPLRAA